MCMLGMLSAGAAKAKLNRLTLSPLPRTSQEHYTALPSTAQPEPLLHQTKHVHYYYTSLPKCTGSVEVAATFFSNDSIAFECAVQPIAD